MPIHATGFPPIAAANARVLILGSLPGQASLAAEQYYAHPRNQFWPLLWDVLDSPPLADYAARCQWLRRSGIALWDVLYQGHRPGSLDAAIDPATVTVNAFADFFAHHPRLDTVFFNGRTAEQHFRRRVLSTLADTVLNLHCLPSTSPAHASLSYAQKRQHWLVLRDALATPILEEPTL